MNLRIKPKTYGPLLVRAGGDEALVIETEAGNRLGAGHVSAVDALSPSDLLMASLATCIAISMRQTAKAMSMPLVVLEVSTLAVKATDLPSRFGRFEVVIRTGSPVDASKTEELLTRTKEMCTVGNTLGADVVLQLTP